MLIDIYCLPTTNNIYSIFRSYVGFSYISVFTISWYCTLYNTGYPKNKFSNATLDSSISIYRQFMFYKSY